MLFLLLPFSLCFHMHKRDLYGGCGTLRREEKCNFMYIFYCEKCAQVLIGYFFFRIISAH